MPYLIEGALKAKAITPNELEVVHPYIQRCIGLKKRGAQGSIEILPYSSKNLPVSRRHNASLTGLKDVWEKEVDHLKDGVLRRLVNLGAAHWQWHPQTNEARLVVKRNWADSIAAWIEKRTRQKMK